MKRAQAFLFCAALIAAAAPAFAAESGALADKVIAGYSPYLSDTQSARLRALLTGGPNLTRNIGTEDPAVQQGPHNSAHPASRAACVREVLEPGLITANEQFEALCGARWMAPVRPYPGAPVSEATVCIDRFEFPNLPCEYPVVWVAASQAKQICESQGKRLCDSHEWEGACAGGINEDYAFKGKNPMSQGALRAARRAYNAQRERVFAYDWNAEHKGKRDTRELCGVYSRNDPQIGVPHSLFNSLGKSRRCHSGGSDYRSCGTNTWPAGFKHRCVTRDGVFDMHGNVAEVVNFPRSPGARGRLGGSDRTERKGSFFVYRRSYPDDCRVRQPFEHFNNAATDKHSYYQEGFRCCKDVR